jgi:hypothetical protein
MSGQSWAQTTRTVFNPVLPERWPEKWPKISPRYERGRQRHPMPPPRWAKTRRRKRGSLHARCAWSRRAPSLWQAGMCMRLQADLAPAVWRHGLAPWFGAMVWRQGLVIIGWPGAKAPAEQPAQTAAVAVAGHFPSAPQGNFAKSAAYQFLPAHRPQRWRNGKRSLPVEMGTWRRRRVVRP